MTKVCYIAMLTIYVIDVVFTYVLIAHEAANRKKKVVEGQAHTLDVFEEDLIVPHSKWNQT